MTTSSDGEGAKGARLGAGAETVAGGSHSRSDRLGRMKSANNYHKNPLGTPASSPWTEQLDTNSGAKYFANAATGETSWERPSSMGNAEDGGLSQTSASPSTSGARPLSLKLSPMGDSRKF